MREHECDTQPNYLSRTNFTLQGDAAFQRVWDAQFLLRAPPALGLPILAVSTGLVGRTPVGVQIIASRYREDLCLCAGEAIETRGAPRAPIDPSD